MLVIDIETTHFNKDKGYIAEVGIVRLDLSNGERGVIVDEPILERGSTLEGLCESWFFKNSDFDEVDFAVARPLEVEKLQALVDRDPDGVTAFNSPFDFGWLESRGLSFPCKRNDPMILSRHLVRARDKNGRIKNPNVEEAWAFFFPDDPYKEKHRAADDAMHEAAIIYELFKLGYYGKF